MPVISQFPESGSDALPLMTELAELFCRESEVGGNSVVTGVHLHSSVFSRPTDSSDDDYPGSETVFQDDLSEIADRNPLFYMDNPT